jgi:hypothetical protein
MRKRTAAVVLAVAALLGTSAAVASAAPAGLHYRTYFVGAFPDQASCTPAQVARNDPPDVISSACFYDTTSPGPGAGIGPGWYYAYKYLID